MGGVNSTTETTSEVQSKSENDAANTANVQNEAKVTENKVETSNIENQSAKEVKVDQSVGSTTTNSKEEQKTSLENKSEANETGESKVEKANPVEGKSESHEDLPSDKKQRNETQEIQTQTLKLTSAAVPPSAKALAESKLQDPITVTINLHAQDADEIVTSLTYNGKNGDTLKNVGEYVQTQINKDNEGYMQPNISGIDTVDSPLVTTYKTTDQYIPGFLGYDGITDPTLKAEYDKWYADKKKNHLLAGYTIDIDSLSSDPLVNGQTYNLTLGEEESTTQFPVYHPMTRTINYVKYIKNNSTETARPSITQDGTTNVHNSSNTIVKNYQKEEENRTLLVYGTIKRSYNVATGIPDGITDEYGNTGTYILFPEQDNPEIKDWMTPDPNVAASANPGENKAALANRPKTGIWYAFIGHTLYQGDGFSLQKMKNLGTNVFEVEPITITYYHNQPVDLSFEDISKIDPQDLSGNNYEASNELTYDNTASNQYDVYGALNKGGQNLNDVIKSIEAKGYKLVSITNDDDDSQTDLKGNSSIDLTYNKDGVWKSATGGDNADNLIHKRYTIKFEHNIANNQTIKTSTTRTVHYVADDANYSVLKAPDTETVNFTTTGDIDLATNSYIDPATNKQIKVTKNEDGTYTMAIDDASQVTGWKADGSDSFAKKQQDKFNNDGLIKGVWNIEYASDSTADGAKLADKFAPEVANVSAQKYNDIYLVYNKAKAQYNIHYVDVSGSNKTSDFVPDDGNEFTPHEVKNVNGDVDDTPNATSKLWGAHTDSNSGYGDLGYVAVGISTNATNGKLANQELTEGVQDQYVYLKHKAVEITSKTPNPPKNSSVDPKDLTKSAERIIHYVTEKDKTPLLDDTTQKITFEGTAYVDAVTGANVKTEDGTDALTGQKVLIATTTPGKITWTVTAGDGSTVQDNKGSFNQVTKPVITDGKLAGTWTVTDATANNAKQDDTDLDPASSDFDPHREVTLEYTKDVNADIIYIDDTDSRILIPKASDTDEHGKPGQDVHFAQDPQTNITNFESQGYILVRDDYGTGQKYGDTDSHYEIHFVHGVDKKVEHKSSIRIIHYVTQDGDQVLLDPTNQDAVTFTKTTYTDKVTHKTVGIKQVQDAEGNTVEASDNTETTPTWVVDGNDKFAQVTKPEITNGKLAGKWLVTSDTADNAPEFSAPLPSDPNFKEVYEATLKYVQNVNADITYWDVTDGMAHKVQMGNTDNASDPEGRTGNVINFNNNDKRISNYEGQNYVFVGTDYARGDKYGKEDSHFNVYFRHAVTEITPNTPAGEVPKNPDGTPIVNPEDLHKEFNRTIFYKANTADGATLMDSTKQHVEFNGTVLIDMVTGRVTTLETVKDVNGKDVQVATANQTDFNQNAIKWDHASQNMKGIVQKYITLDKGNKYATSNDMIGTWHWISGKADSITLTPDSKNPDDLTLVYVKNKSQSGPDDSYDLPTLDVKQETKTFTRTIVYRGTKDGKNFVDVNGSPDGKSTYKQTVTFTRNVVTTTDKDGKVTVLETTPWKTTDSMGQVDSKKPGEVGYDKVDVPSVTEVTVDPNSDKTDLGTTVVTYTVNPPVEETHHVTVHYVDVDGNVIKDPVRDVEDFKNGESYDENGKKDSTIVHDGKTYEFTRVKEGDNPTGTIQGKDVDVTYVYKLKKTPVNPPVEETHHVTVHYVDVDGNVIKDPVRDVKDFKNGESYDENGKKDSTIVHDGKTYEFTRVKEGDNPTGTINGKDVDVTYVYKLKEEPVTPPVENTYHVTVHYVDEDGNVIKDPIKDSTDYKNGQSYDENSKKDSTIEHDGKTYEFTRVKEGDNPTGTIPGKDVDVTYVYKLKKEPVTPVVPPVENTYHVTVHYVDEDGNVIKDPVKDSTDYKNGESYDENSKKDTTIEHDGKTYVFTRVKEGDNPTGTIEGKDVDVTYVYKLKEEPVTPPTDKTYNVTVNFVDENGHVLQDPRHSTDHKNGTDYNETDHPTTITKDGKTYTYTRVEDDTPSGKINGRDVVITYVYKEVKTPVTPPVENTYHVTVHYVDEDGNVIKDPVKDSTDFKNGESYDENSKKDTTIEHDGKTYVFTRVKEGDSPAGTIQGKDVDVTYVYKLKETPVTPPVENTYHVTVHYVDEDGNVIKDPVKDSKDYKDGETYDENGKKDSTIEHDGKTYVFTRVKEGDSPAGSIQGKDIDVTYVYKLKETPVTPVVPPVEETYNVTVHYVDEDGNVIKDPIKDSTDYKNGQSYDENSKKDSTIEHDGKTYVFTRVKEGDIPAGTIEGKDVDVTYVYRLKEEPVTPVVPPVGNTYNVTVNFVDENGNVLQDPRHSSDHKNGTDYNESDHPTTITKDSKTYTYTRVEGDTPTGTVNGKDVVITYVYKEVATPVTPVVPPVEETHTVTVHYIDENGNVVKNPVKDSPDYKNGQSYDENSRKDATIEHDGKTYVFTRVQEGSNPTGTIEGKDVDVTYVYKLKETPATPVTPVKPSGKTTTPVKDHNVQPSNTKVSTQKNSTTSTVKTLSNTTSEVSTTPSPARQNNMTKAPSSKPNKLPQTGKKDTSLASILGLATLGVASVLTLFVDRKKKN